MSQQTQHRPFALDLELEPSPAKPHIARESAGMIQRALAQGQHQRPDLAGVSLVAPLAQERGQDPTQGELPKVGTGAQSAPTSAGEGGVEAQDTAPDLVPLATDEPKAEGGKPLPNGLSLLMRRGSKQTAGSGAKAAAGSGRRARKPRSTAGEEGQAKLVAAAPGDARMVLLQGNAAAAPSDGGAADDTLPLPKSNQDPPPSGNGTALQVSSSAAALAVVQAPGQAPSALADLPSNVAPLFVRAAKGKHSKGEPDAEAGSSKRGRAGSSEDMGAGDDEVVVVEDEEAAAGGADGARKRKGGALEGAASAEPGPRVTRSRTGSLRPVLAPLADGGGGMDEEEGGSGEEWEDGGEEFQQGPGKRQGRGGRKAAASKKDVFFMSAEEKKLLDQKRREEEAVQEQIRRVMEAEKAREELRAQRARDAEWTALHNQGKQVHPFLLKRFKGASAAAESFHQGAGPGSSLGSGALPPPLPPIHVTSAGSSASQRPNVAVPGPGISVPALAAGPCSSVAAAASRASGPSDEALLKAALTAGGSDTPGAPLSLAAARRGAVTPEGLLEEVAAAAVAAGSVGSKASQEDSLAQDLQDGPTKDEVLASLKARLQQYRQLAAGGSSGGPAAPAGTSVAPVAAAGSAQEGPAALWTHRYAPTRASELCGNSGSAAALKAWLEEWRARISAEGDSAGAAVHEAKSQGSGGGSRGKAAGRSAAGGRPRGGRASGRSRRALDSDSDNGDDDWFQDCPRGRAGDESDEDDELRLDDCGSQAKALLLTGPSGSGKTAAAYAVARELGFSVLEVNCSGERSGQVLLRLAGEATQSNRLTVCGSGTLNPAAMALAAAPGGDGAAGGPKRKAAAPSSSQVASGAPSASASPQKKKGRAAKQQQQQQPKRTGIASFFGAKAPPKQKAAEVVIVTSEEEAEVHEAEAVSKQKSKQKAAEVVIVTSEEDAEVQEVEAVSQQKSKQKAAEVVIVTGEEEAEVQEVKTVSKHEPEVILVEEQSKAAVLESTTSKLRQQQQQQQQQPGTQPQQPSKTLLLLEEVDLLLEEDRGFLAAVVQLVAESKRPILLTCNARQPPPQLAGLMLGRTLAFSLPDPAVLTRHVAMVCAAEGTGASLEQVRGIVQQARGDIRQSLLLAQLQVGCCPQTPDAGSFLEEGPVCSEITAAHAKGKGAETLEEKKEEKAARGGRSTRGGAGGRRLNLKAPPPAPSAQAAPKAAAMVPEPLELVSEALRAGLPEGAPPSAVLTYAAGLVAALPTHVPQSSKFGLEAVGGNEARHAWDEARRGAAVEALWDGIEVAKKRRGGGAVPSCKGSSAAEKAPAEAPPGSAASAMAAALAAAGPRAAAPPVELLALPDGVPETLMVLCNSKQGLFNLRTQAVEFQGKSMTASQFEQACGRGDNKKWKHSLWVGGNGAAAEVPVCTLGQWLKDRGFKTAELRDLEANAKAHAASCERQQEELEQSQEEPQGEPKEEQHQQEEEEGEQQQKKKKKDEEEVQIEHQTGDVEETAASGEAGGSAMGSAAAAMAAALAAAHGAGSQEAPGGDEEKAAEVQGPCGGEEMLEAEEVPVCERGSEDARDRQSEEVQDGAEGEEEEAKEGAEEPQKQHPVRVISLPPPPPAQAKRERKHSAKEASEHPAAADIRSLSRIASALSDADLLGAGKDLAVGVSGPRPHWQHLSGRVPPCRRANLTFEQVLSETRGIQEEQAEESRGVDGGELRSALFLASGSPAEAAATAVALGWAAAALLPHWKAPSAGQVPLASDAAAATQLLQPQDAAGLLEGVMEDTAPSAAVIGTWGGAWERAAFLGRMGHIGLLKASEATARRRRPQRYLTTQLGLDDQQVDGLVAFASFGID